MRTKNRELKPVFFTSGLFWQKIKPRSLPFPADFVNFVLSLMHYALSVTH